MTESVGSCETPPHVFVCSYDNCKKSFTKMSRLRQHFLSHTGEKSQTRILNSEIGSLITYLTIQNHFISRPHLCTVSSCTKSYARAAHLKRHVETAHVTLKNIQSISCPMENCEQKFVNNQNLQKHVKRIHQQKDTYRCLEDGCDEVFRKKVELRHHLYTHKGVLPFQCHFQNCLKKFENKGHLERHLKVHQGYTCPESECGQWCETWSLLLKHKRSFHKKDERCPVCKMVYKRDYFELHMQTHQESREMHQCPHQDCQHAYVHLPNLKTHIRQRHEGLKYDCPKDDCSKVYSSKRSLHAHQKKVHSGTGQIPQKPKKKRNPRKKKKKPMIEKLFQKALSEELNMAERGNTGETKSNQSDHIGDISLDEDFCNTNSPEVVAMDSDSELFHVTTGGIVEMSSVIELSDQTVTSLPSVTELPQNCISDDTLPEKATQAVTMATGLVTDDTRQRTV